MNPIDSALFLFCPYYYVSPSQLVSGTKTLPEAGYRLTVREGKAVGT
jgi:hypothetical protein